MLTIQQIISSPKDQGIAYAAAIAPNAISLFNIGSYLTAEDIVLHIDHSPAQNTNIIHSEYELVKEGSANTVLPLRIINKLQDSLAGADAAGFAVPDPKLNPSERYGIEIRPRQTMFVDRLTAVENFVKYTNSVFALYAITDRFDLQALQQGETQPAANTGAWDLKVNSKDELLYTDTTVLPNGYLVLVNVDSDNSGLWTIYQWDLSVQSWSVNRIQSYLTSLYYTPIDWYEVDFDPTLKPTYTVDRYVDMKKLKLAVSDTILVKDNGDLRFAYYRVAADSSLQRVGSQYGTIELSSSLYDLAAGSMGFDNDNFDSIRFDQSPINEIRDIVAAVFLYFPTNDLQVEINQLFFSLVNYIFSEQSAPDWIFKTSFISVVHQARQLAQYPTFIKDNQTFYQDYINEVKPYRTQIRDYVAVQNGIDYLHSGVADFDLPPYYDAVSKTYRSPDGTSAADAAILASTDYAEWNNNHAYQVTAINVARGGSGYTFAPTLVITGGGGSGAVAHATVANGSIVGVVIVNAGRGYTNTPQIAITGIGSGAVLVPVLRNEFYKSSPGDSYNTVRNLTTTIKFDRTSFQSNVVQWSPNTAFSATLQSGPGAGNVWIASGNLVSNNNQIYLPIAANTATETTFDAALYQPIAAGNVLLTANNRIMGYYNPGVDQPGRSLAQLVNGTEYPGVSVTALNFAGNVAALDSSISGEFLDAALGARPEDINIDGGAYVDAFSSHAPEEMLPGCVFDNLNMSVYTKINSGLGTMAYRISHNMQNNSASSDSALWPSYYKIDTARDIKLTKDLKITDTEIHVNDARLLGEPNVFMKSPGVIYINGEKITYYTRNVENNTLGQIRRAVDGTGAPAVHSGGSFNSALSNTFLASNSAAELVDSTGSAFGVAAWIPPAAVVESSRNQLIPGGTDVHFTTWLNPPGAPSKFIVSNLNANLANAAGDMLATATPTPGAITDGRGLEGSTTAQATFIKSSS